MRVAPSRDVVHAKACRLLPDRDVFEVLRILDAATSTAPAPDRPRIQLAVLKLFEEAAGTHDVDTIARWAEDDWRDVLTWAQYPRESRREPGTATADDRAADAAQW